MQIRLDPDVNALSIEARAGEVAKTLETSESVFVDVDEEGAPLGMEFVNADDFIPFLREHAGGVESSGRVERVAGSAGCSLTSFASHLAAAGNSRWPSLINATVRSSPFTWIIVGLFSPSKQPQRLEPAAERMSLGIFGQPGDP